VIPWRQEFNLLHDSARRVLKAPRPLGQQDGESLGKMGSPAGRTRHPRVDRREDQRPRTRLGAGYAEDVAAIATENHIPAEEAQVILDTALDVAATIVPSGEEPNLANKDECMAVMNNRWGEQPTKELIADA
jgi:hypothetical protein